MTEHDPTLIEEAKRIAAKRLSEQAAEEQAAYEKKVAEEAEAHRVAQIKGTDVRKANSVALKGMHKDVLANVAAQQELARRELARRRLMPFVLRFNAAYLPGWVHKDICQRLEQFSQDVKDKKSPRLMLFMPPRSGKSELASKNFPAWHLGQYPEHEIIACSHTSSLAMSFSRKVRALCREKGYSQVFPKMKLDPDVQSAENWITTAGGGYIAAGVGSAIVGKGAHILVIDDPVKNREEAESESTQSTVQDWYTGSAYTRLAPGGGVLIIQQRWDDRDLSGWLLALAKEGDGDQFEVVRYPALAEQDERFRRKGEPLHPERYDLEALTRIRRAVGERDWAALYQQTPMAEEGNYFTKGMFKYYPSPAPQGLRIYAAWDLAITKKEQSDWTVGVVVGVDHDDNIYLLHMERGRWDGFEIVEKILDTYRDWHPEITGIESGQIQSAIGPFLEKRIAERKQHSFYYAELPTRNKDKVSRARAIQGRMQQGKVLFPMGTDWMASMKDEMLRFPNGTHDDMVDALAWIGRMLTDIVGNAMAVPKARSSWRDKLNKFAAGVNARRTAMAG